MKLSCPQCSRDIASEDINIQSAIAKCSGCSSVFSFAAALSAGPGAPSKRHVEMPKGFTVGQEGSELLLTRRWFSAKYAFMLAFCVFWDGFLVFWYFIAFTKGGPMVMKLFPLIHVAVGVGLSYATLAGFINKTRIRASPAELSVRHGPLPWPGQRLLARQEIEQLFCQEKVSHSKNGTSVSYDVAVTRRGGGRLTLISGLEAAEQALFIEQKLEGFLGIQDRPVAGEMRAL